MTTTASASPAAGLAVRDEVDLFGWPEQLLGCRHTPEQGARAGIVVCLPAPFDSAVDEGRAARLGRRLARAGVAVQRFHYRGSPASDGDPAAITFASLVDDARRAAELLRERTGVERIGLVGVRLGALVAARLGREQRTAPVALWQPVVEPTHVVEQAARARAAARHAHPPAAGRAWPGSGPQVPAVGAEGTVEPGPGAGAVEPAIDGERRLDLFDTPLCADLVHGGAVGRLADELGDRPGELLVVQTGPDEGFRPAYRALVDDRLARRLPVDLYRHPCDGWRDVRVVPAAAADALVEVTASWLAARLLAEPAA